MPEGGLNGYHLGSDLSEQFPNLVIAEIRRSAVIGLLALVVPGHQRLIQSIDLVAVVVAYLLPMAGVVEIDDSPRDCLGDQVVSKGVLDPMTGRGCIGEHADIPLRERKPLDEGLFQKIHITLAV